MKVDAKMKRNFQSCCCYTYTDIYIHDTDIKLEIKIIS